MLGNHLLFHVHLFLTIYSHYIGPAEILQPRPRPTRPKIPPNRALNRTCRGGARSFARRRGRACLRWFFGGFAGPPPSCFSHICAAAGAQADNARAAHELRLRQWEKHSPRGRRTGMDAGISSHLLRHRPQGAVRRRRFPSAGPGAPAGISARPPYVCAARQSRQGTDAGHIRTPARRRRLRRCGAPDA